jgi:hypothetical protein
MNNWSGTLHSEHTEKKGKYNETLRQLFIDLEKAYDSVTREVMYNIFIEIGIYIRLVKLIKMCLNEVCSKVCISRNLSGAFPIQNGPKQWNALSPSF